MITKSCRNGHPRTTANGHMAPRGRWICRICKRARDAKRYAEQHQNPYADQALRPGKSAEVTR